MEFDVYSYIILPLLVFVSRIFDVTIGTIRIIVVSKGNRLAPLLGFIEVLIWVVVISQVMNNLNNWVCYIFYAGGFATGNYIGMIIEEKIALGMVGLRLVTAKPAIELINCLKDKGYGLTYIDAKGLRGPVNVMFITLSRKKLNELIELINKYNPGAFYTIEDIRMVNKGVFAQTNKDHIGLFKRKSK